MPSATPAAKRRRTRLIVAVVTGFLVICGGLAAIGALANPPSNTGSNSAAHVGGAVVVTSPSPTATTAVPAYPPPTSAPTPTAAPPATSAKPTHTAPPTHTSTKPHTTKPTHTSPPTHAVSLCGAPSNPYGFNFCGRGHAIYASALPGGVCSYFNCIPNFDNGRGYMVECKDSTYSMSGGIQGACSHHSGEWREVYSG